MTQRAEKSSKWTASGFVLAGIAVLIGSVLSPVKAQPPAGVSPTGAAGASGGGRGGYGGRGAPQFADWATFGHDPQRTGWAFEETRISPDSVSQMKLVWKTKLESEPYSLY